MKALRQRGLSNSREGPGKSGVAEQLTQGVITQNAEPPSVVFCVSHFMGGQLSG